MAAHDGQRRNLEGVVETRLGAVRKVDHHADAVHFAHHTAPKFRETAVLGAPAVGMLGQIGLVRPSRVADVIVAVVAKRGIDHAATAKVCYIGQICSEGKGIFDAGHHTAQPCLLVGREVGGRIGHAGLRTIGHHVFQPVENLIGLGGGGGIGGSAATVLRKIGHHDRGIETAFGHFVNVDKDFRIAAVEIDVLIEEHRRVAMRIEREVRGVPTSGATIVVRFAHKVGEKCARILAFEAFGMPLYAQNALALRAFHGFDDAVGSNGRDTQVRAGGVDRLVVEGID